MASEKTQDEKVAKLDALIRDIKVAMFTTVDDQSERLYSRPMHVQGGLENGELLFFTYAASGKVEDFKQDRHVNCAFAKPDAAEFASVSGIASLTRDRKLMEERWEPTLKAWFPDGIDTPDIALIRVRVSDAQYWDSRNQAMIHAYGMVKAAVTGRPVKDAGENEKVNL